MDAILPAHSGLLPNYLIYVRAPQMICDSFSVDFICWSCPCSGLLTYVLSNLGRSCRSHSYCCHISQESNSFTLSVLGPSSSTTNGLACACLWRPEHLHSFDTILQRLPYQQSPTVCLSHVDICWYFIPEWFGDGGLEHRENEGVHFYPAHRWHWIGVDAAAVGYYSL